MVINLRDTYFSGSSLTILGLFPLVTQEELCFMA